MIFIKKINILHFFVQLLTFSNKLVFVKKYYCHLDKFLNKTLKQGTRSRRCNKYREREVPVSHGSYINFLKKYIVGLTSSLMQQQNTSTILKVRSMKHYSTKVS